MDIRGLLLDANAIFQVPPYISRQGDILLVQYYCWVKYAGKRNNLPIASTGCSRRCRQAPVFESHGDEVAAAALWTYKQNRTSASGLWVNEGAFSDNAGYGRRYQVRCGLSMRPSARCEKHKYVLQHAHTRGGVPSHKSMVLRSPLWRRLSERACLHSSSLFGFVRPTPHASRQEARSCWPLPSPIIYFSHNKLLTVQLTVCWSYV